MFSPEKIGDFSHHWSSVIGMPAISRVPSGRRVDSTWMTSAPSIASMCVLDGPAQKVVMSTTRSPSNGNLSETSIWASIRAFLRPNRPFRR